MEAKNIKYIVKTITAGTIAMAVGVNVYETLTNTEHTQQMIHDNNVSTFRFWNHLMRCTATSLVAEIISFTVVSNTVDFFYEATK